MKAIAVKHIKDDTSGIKRAISIIAELSKIRITFFVALSASAGYVLNSGRFDADMIVPVLAVFILACGSSALNHFQERKFDALMERTKRRPLPSGQISSETALLILSIMIGLGLFLIYISVNIQAMAAGATAVIWYNAIYTPLKRMTPMAVIPGALIGAIPPVIGWMAAGGSMMDMRILVFALFIFIWQIPHFWLLLIIYSGDYATAGYPVFSGRFTSKMLAPVTFLWILILAVCGSLIPLGGLTGNPVITGLLVLSGIWLLWRSRKIMLRDAEKRKYWHAFRDINNYVLFVVVLLSLGKIINL
ncbi:MAG: protoheme IX farnesyltransferase [Syntrophothermus sp.]